jgi:ankyrin repeat protein
LATCLRKRAKLRHHCGKQSRAEREGQRQANIDLHDACCDLDFDKVKDLLNNHHADVNYQDHYGYTALHWAAFKCSPELCQLLLEHRANQRLDNHRGDTAFSILFDSSLTYDSTSRLRVINVLVSALLKSERYCPTDVRLNRINWLAQICRTKMQVSASMVMAVIQIILPLLPESLRKNMEFHLSREMPSERDIIEVQSNAVNIDFINPFVSEKHATPLFHAYQCQSEDRVRILLKKSKPALDVDIEDQRYSLLLIMLEDYDIVANQASRFEIFDAYVSRYNITSKDAMASFKRDYMRSVKPGVYRVSADELSVRFDHLLQSYIGYLQTRIPTMLRPEGSAQKALFIAYSGAAKATPNGSSLFIKEFGTTINDIERIKLLVSAGADVPIQDESFSSLMLNIIKGNLNCSPEIINCMMPAFLKLLSQSLNRNNAIDIVGSVVFALPKLTNGPIQLKNFIHEIMSVPAYGDKLAIILNELMSSPATEDRAYEIIPVIAKVIAETACVEAFSSLARRINYSDILFLLIVSVMDAGMDPATITPHLPKKEENKYYAHLLKPMIVLRIGSFSNPLTRLQYCESTLFDATFPFHSILSVPSSTVGPKKLIECSLDKGSFKKVKNLFEDILLQDRQLFQKLKPATQAWYMQRLALAVVDNNSKEVVRLSQLGVSMNACGDHQHPPLIQALLVGSFNAAKALLVLEADIYTSVTLSRSQLLIAAKKISKKAEQRCENWLSAQVGSDVTVIAIELAKLVGNDDIIRLFEQRSQVLPLQNSNNASLPEVPPPSYQASQAERIRAGMPPSYQEISVLPLSSHPYMLFTQPSNASSAPRSSSADTVQVAIVHAELPPADQTQQLYPFHLLRGHTNFVQQPLSLIEIPSAPLSENASELPLSLPNPPQHKPVRAYVEDGKKTAVAYKH